MSVCVCVHMYACLCVYSYAVIAYGCAECPKLSCGREGCDTEFCYHCRQLWHPDQTCDQARRQRARYTTGAEASTLYVFNEESGGGMTPPENICVCVCVCVCVFVCVCGGVCVWCVVYGVGVVCCDSTEQASVADLQMKQSGADTEDRSVGVG